MSGAMVIGCLAVLALASSCAGVTKVRASVPESTVTAVLPNGQYEIHLSPQIASNFELPSHNGVSRDQVQGWWKTLQAGFDGAFAPQSAAGAVWVLYLDRAELDLVRAPKRRDPSAMLASLEDIRVAHGGGHSSRSPKPPPIYARIIVRARLEGSLLTEPRATTFTAYSLISVGEAGSATEAVKAAVENMYRWLASMLFEAQEDRGGG